MCDIISRDSKVTLIIDNVHYEPFYKQIISNFTNINDIKIYQDDLNADILNKKNSSEKSILILKPIVKLLLDYNEEQLFTYINKMKKCIDIKKIFLWVRNDFSEGFLIPFLEYMSDEIITFEEKNSVRVLIKKVTGSTQQKFYNYEAKGTQLSFNEVKDLKIKVKKEPAENTPIGTFKINLEKNELIAREAAPLPYEIKRDNNNEINASKIIYQPDANDDFDDEDPDEDLYI